MRKDPELWALGALVVLTLLGGWLLMARPKVTLRGPDDGKFDQVRVGMSREEVIHTVGAPPGDFTSGTGFYMDAELYTGHERWVGLERTLLVRFDESGITREVVRKATFRPTRAAGSWW